MVLYVIYIAAAMQIRSKETHANAGLTLLALPLVFTRVGGPESSAAPSFPAWGDLAIAPTRSRNFGLRFGFWSLPADGAHSLAVASLRGLSVEHDPTVCPKGSLQPQCYLPR